MLLEDDAGLCRTVRTLTGRHSPYRERALVNNSVSKSCPPWTTVTLNPATHRESAPADSRSRPRGLRLPLDPVGDYSLL